MFNAQLLYGEVNQWKPGYARVLLPQFGGILTDWLQIRKDKAMNDDVNIPLEVGEQVCILTDQYCRTGVVMGALSNAVDVPDGDAAAGKYRWKFADGTFFEYDKDAHKLSVGLTDSSAEVNMNVGSDITLDMKAGKVTLSFSDGGVLEYDKGSGLFKMTSGSGESLFKILNDFLTGITLLTVPTPAGDSSVPLNVVTFNNLLTRLGTLLH